MIEVIFTKFFTACFKMAESFDNLDNILHVGDWAKDKGQKNLAEALNRFKKQEERYIVKPFLLKNDSEKILEQSQSAVERD